MNCIILIAVKVLDHTMINCPIYKVGPTFTQGNLMHQASNNCISILKTFLVENYSFRLGIRDFQFSILIAVMQYSLTQIAKTDMLSRCVFYLLSCLKLDIQLSNFDEAFQSPI